MLKSFSITRSPDHPITRFLLIAYCLSLPLLCSAQKTVTGNIQDIAGNVPDNVALIAQVENCSTNIVSGGNGSLITGKPVALDTAGNFSIVFQDETTLKCGATAASAYYRLSVVQLDPITGRIKSTIAYDDYDITGSGTVALKDLTPRNPAPPAVPAALLLNPAGDQTAVIPAGKKIVFSGGTVDLSGTNCIGCGTGTGSGGAVFVDNEIPSGTINGVNTAFTLAQAPSPALSLILARNGIVQISGGIDYTLTGSSIAFGTSSIPQTGDSLRAWYRTSNGTQNFADFDTPTGAINGSNTTFTLAHVPSPAADLLLLRNGMTQVQGVDYTLSSSTVTFLSGAIPQTGDSLRASYRY